MEEETLSLSLISHRHSLSSEKLALRVLLYHESKWTGIARYSPLVISSNSSCTVVLQKGVAPMSIS